MSEQRGLAHGIYPYLPSPIDGDGRVLVDVLERLVVDLVDAGVHGMTPLGSTGEVTYLSLDQRAEIATTVVRAVDRRVPVVAGVAAFATDDAVSQARRLEQLGVDGLVVMRQQALPTTAAGVVEYFRAVAEAVDIPIVLYTNPGVLGTDLTIDNLRQLAEIDNVRYLKDASGVTGRILTVLNELGDRLELFSASAHIPLVVFELGGVGWMAGPACVVPDHAVALYESWRRGDRDTAWALQRAMWPVNEVFQRHGLGACIKAALELRGYAVGAPIHPQHALGDAAVDEIRSTLERADHALATIGTRLSGPER